MEADFWHNMWASGKVGFHRLEVNEFLQTYWPSFNLSQGAEVLVPLCGKSLDMHWLTQQGQRVLGVELSAKALDEFLAESQLTAEPIKTPYYSGYQLADMTLLCGDFFHLTAQDCEEISAVYDRAALVAFPPKMRVDYAQHLSQILPIGTQILLITMEYESPKLQGPPFSVLESEVKHLYGEHFDIEKLLTHPIQRQGEPVDEKVFRLIKIA